jgi:DNA-binding GntR family transcriptional regulator
MPKTSGTKSERKNSKMTLRQRRPPVRRVQPGVAAETHKSARDRIRGALLKRISEGVYQPGERLKEMTLAREFNVSQAPVREAFRELETLGVLISEHYRGTRIREISKQETQDVYHLRGYLEEIAAQLISPANLKKEIGSIEAMQVEMRAAARTGDMDGFARTNTQFHRSIVGMAPNQMLLKVWDSFEIGMRSRLNLQKNEDRLLSLAEIHQPIVDSLKLGDLKRTGVLLREHAFSILKDIP